ncbi:MAG: HAMP domain-containing histidine kinase, partial [Anaerolineae bacterium]|nr:HAMP domain-containing histidine kinase [Anaerolineae bacterium]
AADKAKSDFVANVSHELRTPMTSIKGYADLLLLEAAGGINPDQRRFLEVIKNNADRLTALVNDLLTISSIEQQGIRLDIQPIRFSEVIDDIRLSMETRMRTDGKEMTLITNVPEDTPPIEADYNRIVEIIGNLALNSYQYTPTGGMVTINVIPQADGVQVDVVDTGIGTPEEHKARIFERFFRGVENPMVMAVAGTGLGLAITRHFVNMHNGRIWFESEAGVGSTFSVWLPYQFRAGSPDETP